MTVVKEKIIEKLQVAFSPIHLEVINESDQHNVPPGSESHFKVLIVAESFKGLKRIERQRKINGVLAEELNGMIHALAQRALSPDEWESASDFTTPDCRGGSKA